MGSQVRALMRPPPSPWVETFISLLAFIAPEWGFFAPACVSAGGLCLAEGPVCEFVSASKISVPRSSGDRFDDWVVALQFEPSQTARFSRDANAKSPQARECSKQLTWRVTCAQHNLMRSGTDLIVGVLAWSLRSARRQSELFPFVTHMSSLCHQNGL
jgi:hypothetical protein